MRAYSIAMVAACPFPANHGTPAAIKEMSEELARRGHSIRVVTYPLSHDIPVAGVEIDRVAHIGSNREVNVGPSYQRLIFDALLVVKLFQIVRRHQVELIHAHNYEAMLIGGVVGRLTGVPVIYNAINTMISELPSYNFLRSRALATGLAKAFDFVVPRMADVVIADTEELRAFILDQGVEAVVPIVRDFPAKWGPAAPDDVTAPASVMLDQGAADPFSRPCDQDDLVLSHCGRLL
jgi:1,2-diacylglycerol 3-alpha-glucosyltransferase